MKKNNRPKQWLYLTLAGISLVYANLTREVNVQLLCLALSIGLSGIAFVMSNRKNDSVNDK